MRQFVGVVLGIAVLAAGCSAPVADPGSLPDFDRGPAPSDPTGDTLGWEGGYWYNESLSVTSGDGVNTTEREALVARTMARVEHIRRLEFEEPVPVEVVSRETYRREFAGGNRTYSDAFRRFDNAKFEAMFLIGEEEDSLAVQNTNRGSNVLGFYSAQNDSIVVVSDDGKRLPGETTLAHELVHALQDRRWGLDSFDRPTRERYNAVNGLIEGDASLVGHTYRARCDGPWDCFRPSTERRSGDRGSIHFGVYFLNYFPYSDGPGFVSHWRDQHGWDGVNDLYDDPPASTEQVIYPDLYREDAPTNVTLTDRTRNGWTRVRLGPNRSRPNYAVLGQSALSSSLAYTFTDQYNLSSVVSQEEFVNADDEGLSRLDPFNYDLRYTRGWDGDRLHVYRRNGETAYVWRIVWDSRAEAEVFAEGYRALLRHWDGRRTDAGVWYIDRGPFEDAFAIRVDGNTVTIVNAPTVDALDGVRSPA